MIIVKTKNGDRFVNDKAVIMVEHDREKAVVNAHGEKGLYYHIEDVEGVIYTNDAQPTSWQDEGSEIQRVTKALSEQLDWGSKMRDEYMKMEQERNELKAKVGNLQVELNTLKGATEELKPTEAPDRWWPDNVDIAPISTITRHIGSMRYDPGYEVRLGKLFEIYNINTVGDLLRIGRRDFKKYRSVGTGSITRIDDALEDLYDIKGW
jgi:hypothetical protein